MMPWGIPGSSTDPCAGLSRDRWMNLAVACRARSLAATRREIGRRSTRRGRDEHCGRPVGDVVAGQEVRRLHRHPHAPDLPPSGAIMPVLLGEEHPPTQHRAGHPAQLVDPPQRLSGRRRARQPQDLAVRGRHLIDVCGWPPHTTEDAADRGRRPDCRAVSRIGSELITSIGHSNRAIPRCAALRPDRGGASARAREDEPAAQARTPGESADPA